ncbi:fumarylacetoacetate hydrolase family protein [Bhargavaea ginsengi]|uniref:fumarylacetoacetate hydrolase family protein n=1 Tax=Bhargavaea ginsengi TaxID=426757 RepID=UPI00203E379F|nr:fumarylacetoacetate hydrolase family protein [Bhargavaea ginsengi]MCM3087546.1 fumarylacetoacetate hydrolase family protein [Bhargavaea ginsengi]
MRLATVKLEGKETAVIIAGEKAVTVDEVNKAEGKNWATSLFEIIDSGQLEEMTDWYNREGKEKILGGTITGLDAASLDYQPLYRNPSKIWGIGLNYVDHASDLGEVAPNTEPASFMKPTTTIIGPGETINIPHQSERTTAEAELGVIIGKMCKDVEESDAMDYIAGYTTIIDMTAEDILQRNPRYLTRSKSFDTFFSFGPQFVTPDEVEDLMKLEVSTVINGELHRKNTVDHMTFNPLNLVSFHSKVMTLLPGDIISTGTPGAVVINDGDLVECRIEGFETLVNHVRDLKVKAKGELAAEAGV